MSEWLQPGDGVEMRLTCEICKGLFEFVNVAACVNLHVSAHPHARCPRCSPKGWAACVMVALRTDGSA